jgi:hypothetical protein
VEATQDGWHSANKSAMGIEHTPSPAQRPVDGADGSRMSRPLRLAGAMAVVISLWLPWYQVRISDAMRHAFDGQAGQLPQGFAAFARGVLAALPASLDLTGWQAFQGADVALAMLAGAVAISVTLAVDLRAVLAGAAAIGALVVFHVVDQPGPNEIVTVRFGAWIALAGAAAIALSAFADAGTPERSSSHAPWAPASTPAEAWTAPPAASVPPPTR